MMVDKLKTLPPIASCHFPAPKKKAQNVANKKKSRNLIKIEQKSNPEYGQNINPISRLIQIQQAKKEKEPVYTLIAERGMPRRREFVMQVGSSDIICIFYRCFFDLPLYQLYIVVDLFKQHIAGFTDLETYVLKNHASG